MNKLEFMNEIGVLADKFAFLLEHYTEGHGGYDGRTEEGKPIIIGGISASIQNGELATIEVSVGSCDSEHRLRINRSPNCPNEYKEWRIEDK